MSKRAIILLLDSVGIGATKDAGDYGDTGSNTLGHILEQHPDTKIPNLQRLGIINCLQQSCGTTYGLEEQAEPQSLYGFAREISRGKDTISGHWELMGCEVDFDWGYFTDLENSFPQSLLDTIVEKSGIAGYLGNCHASGTEIIERLGAESIATGKPIFYTSADSVFQIAVQEEVFGLENLYKLCEVVRDELYALNIGRVIARPFLGDAPENFQRTRNRKDYAIAPSKPILFNKMQENGGRVVTVGKVWDIFAGTGIDESNKASGLEELFDTTLDVVKKTAGEYALIFTNFVDFDSEYGHRRDVRGYKEALEYFDARLPELFAQLKDDDLLVVIADHGNDPTAPGTDHTREHIPVLFYQNGIASVNIGERSSFKDVGESIASYLGFEFGVGESFYVAASMEG